jgi:PAS domain S-box-containing protein
MEILMEHGSEKTELAILNEQLRNEIAERQRLETALHRSEQWLSDFFENATVGMHWIGLDGCVLWANQAQLNLLGYTLDEYLGHSITEFVADQKMLESAFQPLLSHEPSHHYETTLRCKDGSIKSVRVDSNVLWEEDSVVHTCCILSDITDYKQTEAVLRKQERQLNTLLNNIPDIVWLKDRYSRFIAVNKAFSKVRGVSPENIIGKTDDEFRPLPLARKYRDEDSDVMMSRQRKCFEEPLANRFGEITWIETIETPVFNDQREIVGTTGISRDVTQRRELETALRQSEQRLSLALSVTATGIWEWNISAHRSFWSDTMFMLIGREPGSCEPNFQNWLKSVHPEDRKQVERYAEQALVGRNEIKLEYRVVRSDGTIRWLSSIGDVICCNEQGYPTKMTGITIDITDRVESEASLRVSIAQLQQDNKRLEEISRLKSEFLANTSHELRTPLTSILGFSNILLQQHYGILTIKQEEYLSRIYTSGKHLLALINDLLDLMKIEAGKMDLQIETVSLIELCEMAFQIVEVRALEKHQSLSLEQPIACEKIEIDHQRILQVLLNYLSNAIKFTPEGGTITLSTRLVSNLEEEAKELMEDIQPPASGLPVSYFLVLSVSDTGIGIPVEQQHLLFQMFQQVEGTCNRSHEGMGLGLALTKRLVELHGGQVSFVSKPGVGSTFSAWLPLL